MSLTLPARSAKPRRAGITSIVDFGPDTFGWGGAPDGLRNLLACCADHIDYAKIYALNALLLPREIVRAAVRLYLDHGVTPFIGGSLFEYAWSRNDIDGLERLLQELDVETLEISENRIALADDERARLIERFRKRGIAIQREFGRGETSEPLAIEELAAAVEAAAAHGIERLTVEQSDFDALQVHRPGALQVLRAQPWFERLVIEADPYRFPRQHADLIRTFGPDVNLGNVSAGQVLRVEGFRLGIGRAVDYSIIRR
jgi:phosphosulfolactate synthase